MNFSSRYFLFLLVSVFFVPFLSVAAQASLAIAPKDATHLVGNEFTVGVVLDTGGASVNAVEGKIRYLPDDIAVVKIDKGASPVTSWTVEPDYTSESGLIQFGGINPDGISGKGKTLFSITFRVVRSGEARVRLASGAAILAEGGAGTNILTDLRGGTYTLVNGSDLPEAQHSGPSLLRSSSHPDELAWYNTPNVLFEWSRSPDTDQVRFSVDQNPEGAPTGTLEGNIESKAVTLDGGVWYGHLALHDDSGWSPIGHLRLQIDTDRPEVLRILEVPRGNAEEPRPTISFEASDARSGISHFEIAVDGGAPIRWEDDGNHRYELPPLSPGDHVVSVRAFDRAGNSVAETLVVHVEGLTIPTVKPTPASLFVGGELDLEGVVGEGMTARVSIGFDGGESRTEDVASGPGGAFLHTFVFPQEGVYRLKVQAMDQRGATSEWTPEVSVSVEKRSLLGAVGSASGGGILASLIFLVIGLIVGLWFGRASGAVPAFSPAFSGAERGGTSMFSHLLAPLRAGKSLGAFVFRGAKNLLPKRKTPVLLDDEGEDQIPAQSPVPRAPQRVQLPTHTLSLRRKDSDVPPHSPTVLGR